MNSLNLLALAQHTEFRSRVLIMVAYVCHQIVGEGPGTENTAERQRYAAMTLNNSTGYLDRFCNSLVTQPSIAQNIAINGTDPNILDYLGGQTATAEFDKMDIEIMSVISAIFNDMAGIYNLP